jgi:hypothetical protein
MGYELDVWHKIRLNLLEVGKRWAWTARIQLRSKMGKGFEGLAVAQLMERNDLEA